MRFSFKVFLCTLTITAVSIGISGNYFISALFETALNREVELALDENNLLRFAFETAAVNVPSKYDRLPDATVSQIGQALEIDGDSNNRFIRVCSEGLSPIYTSPSFENNTIDPVNVEENRKGWQIIMSGDRYYVQTFAHMKSMNRTLSLETFKDISAVFNERNSNFAIFRQISIVILIAEAVVIYFLSIWLTRPIDKLSAATKIMAGGGYAHRADKISNDELGVLTDDFNKMAESLE